MVSRFIPDTPSEEGSELFRKTSNGCGVWCDVECSRFASQPRQNESNKLLKFAFVALVSNALFTMSVLAEISSEGMRAIKERFSPCLVTVEFKLDLKGTGFLAQYVQHMEEIQRVCAIVVDASGLLITDASNLRERVVDVGSEVGFELGVKISKPRDYVAILHNGQRVGVELLGWDDEFNLAFLRLASEEPLDLSPVAFNQEVELKVGDEIFILGILPAALGHGTMLSTGRISAALSKGFPMYYTTSPLDSFQGGLVVTRDGVPVGIVGTISHDKRGHDGTTNIARLLLQTEQVRTKYQVILPAKVFSTAINYPPQPGSKRAWIGLMKESLRALSKTAAAERGLERVGGIIIERVPEGSPIARAQAKPGDIMLSLDGRDLEITDDSELYVFTNLLRTLRPGDEVECLLLRREGDIYTEITLKVTVEAMPPLFAELQPYNDALLGIRIKDIAYDFCLSHNLPLDTKGVVIVELNPAGDGYFAGLQKFDVIQVLNDMVVDCIEDYRRAVEAFETTPAEEVRLQLLRQGHPFTLTIEILR